MKNLPRLVARSLVWPLLFAPPLARAAIAQEAGAASDEGAYCRFVDATASAEAAREGAPTVASRGDFERQYSGDEGTTYAYDELARVRVGLEYGLGNVRRIGVAHRGGAAECERYRAQRATERALGRLATHGRRAALEARHAVLAPGAAELASRYAKTRDRLKAGAAGLIEVDAVSEALYGVQTAMAADDAEIARLDGAEAGDPLPERAGLERLVTRWEDAERDTREVEQDRKDVGIWDVNVAAGYQRQRADSNVRPGLYASLELRVNLGGATRGMDAPQAAALYRTWLAQAGTELAVKERTALEDVTTRVTELEKRLPLAGERATTLAAYTKATESLGARAASAPQQATTIYGRWLLAKAEAEGLRAEIEALRRFLAPEAQAETAPAVSTAVVAAKEGVKPSTKGVKDTKTAVEAVPDAGFEMRTDVANFRWHLARPETDRATLRFKLVGNTDKVAHLGGGDVRHQLGLMLRMQNQCNLVYAVWRMGENKIVVQEKLNPGESTHEQCENHGYTTVKPKTQIALAPMKPGETHELSARIEATTMTVTVDGKTAWVGPAPQRVKSGGNVGLRADNLVVDYTMLDASKP